MPANPLPADSLRWKCPPQAFAFETTAELDPATGLFGQEAAREALMFGIQCNAPGQNIFIRGARGTGRLSMVRRLLHDLALTSPDKRDRCFVHNFKQMDRPRLISLQPGTATEFRRRMAELADYVQEGLIKALESEPFASERNAIRERTGSEIRQITEPLEADLLANDLALVQVEQGPVTQALILPLVDGKPVPYEELRKLVGQGAVPPARWEQFEERQPKFEQRLQQVRRQVNELSREATKQVRAMNEKAVRDLLAELADRIIGDFPGGGVEPYIGEVIDDAVEYCLSEERPDVDLREVYGVNIVLEHRDGTRRPIIEESTPTMINLLGTVEPKFGPNGAAISDYRGIRRGAILAADQGFLVLDVEDLLAEPGAWRALTRTLRTGRLEIVPPEVGWMQPYVVVQPEPIEIKVRVILVGDMATYQQLDYLDSDFGELFKVLADFDSELPRDASGAGQYAAVVTKLVRDESLPEFECQAVARLTEHGARIASRSGKLTAKFGRIADIAREAAFLAGSQQAPVVLADHVVEAIRRTKQRASLPSRKFQEYVEAGTIVVETQGAVIGQVNGLAVMTAGPLMYGFPARITATIGPGQAGLINIEGQSQMSGAIHTKGFYILGGLLRYLLRTPHPLAFSASLAFEQSYGGIDGDSASGAEMVCLLSALTAIPIRQEIAMTGAIDQHGRLEAVGGVNEKIEGFFDICRYFGLTGSQGVVIPTANAGDLMLRQELVDACRAGRFHVYAVPRIHDAIELLTGVPAGDYAAGHYAEGTVLHRAVQLAEQFWRRTLASPLRMTSIAHPEEPVLTSDQPPPSIEPPPAA